MRNRLQLGLRRGVTLIEMLVVLVIIAGMLGVTLVVTSLLSFSDLNSAAARLSTTMEHVYGRAAINGIRYRLVIDLDEGTYWAECSEENPPLTAAEENNDGLNRFRDGDWFGWDGLDRFGRDYGEEEEPDPFGLNIENQFDDCTEELVPLIQLDDGVQFDSVMTSHHSEPATEGRVEINFFPDGFVEPAYIWLTLTEDDDEPEEDRAVVTLRVEPMTGRVWVVKRRLELPRDFAEPGEEA